MSVFMYKWTVNERNLWKLLPFNQHSSRTGFISLLRLKLQFYVAVLDLLVSLDTEPSLNGIFLLSWLLNIMIRWSQVNLCSSFISGAFFPGVCLNILTLLSHTVGKLHCDHSNQKVTSNRGSHCTGDVWLLFYLPFI